jgi:hypothetical protein
MNGGKENEIISDRFHYYIASDFPDINTLKNEHCQWGKNHGKNYTVFL